MQRQAAADGDYFAGTCGRDLRASEVDIVQQTLLGAHRFQYILSGARHPHFVVTLASLATDAPLDRIHHAHIADRT